MEQYNERGKSLPITIGVVASVICAVKAVIDIVVMVKEYIKQKSNQPRQC